MIHKVRCWSESHLYEKKKSGLMGTGGSVLGNVSMTAGSLTAKTISGSGTTISNCTNPGTVAPPTERDSNGKNIALEFNGIS
ncbi:TPA: hypothetical protein SK282_004368, partial [Yersinia enterocolitica]|nr:hypothetical protein [Yersinia enterocolitica]